MSAIGAKLTSPRRAAIAARAGPTNARSYLSYHLPLEVPLIMRPYTQWPPAWCGPIGVDRVSF